MDSIDLLKAREEELKEQLHGIEKMRSQLSYQLTEVQMQIADKLLLKLGSNNVCPSVW